MLLALLHNREVGVDVERARGNLAPEMLIEQNFDSGNASEIQSMWPARKTAEFFRLWTHTEACMYAAGLALAGRDDLSMKFSLWPR